MSISELYNIFLKHPKISTDTRKIEKDSIFFALKGDNFNGNLFAAEAISKGAAYAVVDETTDPSDKIIVTDNSLNTLQKLANKHRKELGIPIIAITGSNGKTTTKELMNSVLSTKFVTLATSGNLNNHIGVPLTLLKLDNTTEIGIVEMGANHPGEIDELCKIAEPDYGIITNVGKAHIEGFGSFEGVIQTKTELYRHLSENKGCIFCNSNNNILTEHAISTSCKVIYYGQKDDIVWGEYKSATPLILLDITINNKTYSCQTQLIGIYNIENILSAISLGIFFKTDVNKTLEAISNYQPSNMRSQWLQTDRNQLILDAYNANPTSMLAAIENFKTLELKNKVLILGDMLEVGEDTLSEHQNLVDQIESITDIDAILIGPMFKKTKNRLSCFVDISQVIASKQLENFRGNNILIKGSRGIGLEKLITYL